MLYRVNYRNNIRRIKIITSLAIALSTMFFVCLKSEAQSHNWWGKTKYDGKPWVLNESSPLDISYGLQGHHLSVWASHGRYYSPSAGIWKWQRTNLFGTNEDLFTQTFVVPYLIPMLERAGANVFTPRERDWQQHETVIDNDDAMMIVDGRITHGAVTNYVEDGKWKDFVTSGFHIPYHGVMYDGDTPFAQGNARYIKTKKKKANAFVIYSPQIPEEGKYAVYVSYQTMQESVDDAHYIVVHRGIETHFRVNQRIGGGTWVYLGTFDFGQGSSMDNCVIIDNASSNKGVVSTDAVRFGGGMGNIIRGNSLSGLPRALEGARYYAQWAGAPYNIYSTRQGTDDYSDDINVRSLMTNWLAGGSVYVPDRAGKNVPIELSLALHSDAGYNRDMKSIFGSLGICTTDFNDGRLGSGHSRQFSRDFADILLKQVGADMKAIYGKWTNRDLWDKNYSETRLPAMPSAIIEMLSHQSFPDMQLAHDPQFKFNFSRALYKAILKYVTASHGDKYVVSPLQPHNLKITMDNKGKASISWSETIDPLENSARPKAYLVYMAVGDGGYDNGVRIKTTSCSIQLQENVTYRFKVSAINDGGESFPSEEVAAYFHPGSNKQILVVNAFHRLSSPAVRKEINSNGSYTQLGFDFDEDPGVTYGLMAGWAGAQKDFAVSGAGREGPGALGYTGNELVGKFVAGNDFNYIAEHVDAFASAGEYSVVSCSSECLGNSKFHLSDYGLVDIILGNEKYDGHSLGYYKTFPQNVKDALGRYSGPLLVSGSYVASDNVSYADSTFLANMLHVDFRSKYRETTDSASIVNGLGTSFQIWKSVNAAHYASTSSDVVGVPGVCDSLLLTLPDMSNKAFVAMTYANGLPAAIAYSNSDRRTFTMGFPLECIRNRKTQCYIARGILNFLLK